MTQNNDTRHETARDAAETDIEVQDADVRETAGAPDLEGAVGLDFTLPDLPPWTANDYESTITGSGAVKLADSGVAPLIAAARGYKRIDEDNYADEAKRMRIKGTTAQGRRLKRTLTAPGRDGMQMPWYSIAGNQSAFRKGVAPTPHTYQIRPELPELNEAGKPIKYEFLSGTGTPLDLHPAVPVEWIDTTPVVMIAEGMLKGDSALSAYLHAMGVPYEDLAAEGVDDPVARLRSLLEAIPEEDRVLIISIAGINNTAQHPVDWREIDLKGRTGWIAFDADLSVNPFVHAAARKLHQQLDEKAKMANILFLNPEVVSGEDGAMAKAGVDDYLAKVGSWNQLVAMLSEKMPDAPARDADMEAGAWRVSPDGTRVEECVPLNDGPGGTLSGYRWDKRVPLGGRILAMENQRQPTDEELRTGRFNPLLGSREGVEAFTEIEVSWDEGGHKVSHVITGPETILHFTPADWVRQGATIPRALLMHRAWPPRAAKGEGWLSAVKSNRSDETIFRTRWMQMGWVPVEHGDPVFLVGDQVVGDAELGSTAVAGIDSEKLDVAEHYGVGEGNLEGDFDDPDYVEQARADFRAVVDAYVTAKPWTDDATAALVLGGALRPTIPIRPRCTLYFWGPKGKGKAIPMDEKIPVPVSRKFPTGWALNSELELGDEIYAADGTRTAIRTFSDVFEDDAYEFDLSDGRTVRSSAKHLWKVSTAASRAARAASAKKANGAEARRVKATRLREYAATLASGDAAPLPELVSATGFTRNQISAAVSAAGIQYQDVLLSGDAPDHSLTWVDLPVAELAAYVHGRAATFSELADVQRQVSAGRHYTSGKFGTVRVAKSRVYPVAETLTALADHIEHSRAPMPLEKTITAETIAADFHTVRYGIRAIEPVDGPDAVLPVPAYTLGAWLGDGTSREGGFTNPDAEIIDWIRADGYQVTDCTAEYVWYIRGLMTDLRDLDVLENKHIPARYLRGSRVQRLALLQGLMDTDGTITKQGQCELTLTNRRLAHDAADLIRSFGIRARLSESDAAITEHGVRRIVGTRYRIQFTTTEPVFRLSRKAQRLPEKQLENWLFIEGVRKVGPAPVRCLTVEHHTGMFAQDDFVLSHNSWSAQTMMYFWARHLSDWQDRLPGSAKDTQAYMENAIAHTPIWVIDDMAPSAVKRQAEAEDAKLADMTRAIFNNATKGRMNADMTARQSNSPVAQLIITAENELTTPSAKERLIPAYIGKGKLNPDREPTDAINTMAMEEGTQARFTSHVIRFIRRAAVRHPGGWEGYMNYLGAVRTRIKEIVVAKMRELGAPSGSLERTSTLASDILLTFAVLEHVAIELRMEKDFYRQFKMTEPLAMALIKLVTNAHSDNQKAAPGASLVTALAALLASGGAHVISGDDPTRPPAGGSDDSETLANHSLGWTVAGNDGSLRPSGQTIGTVVSHPNGKKIVMFYPETAFTKAQEAFPHLIPHGQGSTAAWASIWDEGLAPAFIKRPTRKNGTYTNTTRLRAGASGIRISGVPIEVDLLLHGLDADTDDTLLEAA